MRASLCSSMLAERFLHTELNTQLSGSYDLTWKRGSVGQSVNPYVVGSMPSKNPTTQIPMDLNFIDLQTRILLLMLLFLLPKK